MPFNEEVPANFKTYMPCKRRSCPGQYLLRKVSLKEPEKRFFTYQCSRVELWASCKRAIDPAHMTEAERAEAAAIPESAKEATTKPPENKSAGEPQPPQNNQTAPAKAPDPAPAPSPEQPQNPTDPQPTEEQLKHRCNSYPQECYLCSPNIQTKCGIERKYMYAPT